MVYNGIILRSVNGLKTIKTQFKRADVAGMPQLQVR